MNKREALKLCEKGWLELADTGAEVKPSMFSGFDCNCPCCEYDTQMYDGLINDSVCPNCPIWSDGECESDDSPYFLWNEAKSTEERKVYAAAVADLARAELDKMGKESP